MQSPGSKVGWGRDRRALARKGEKKKKCSPLLSSLARPLVGMLMRRKQPEAGQTESQLADIYLAITRTGPKMGAKGRKALCSFKWLQV